MDQKIKLNYFIFYQLIVSLIQALAIVKVKIMIKNINYDFFAGMAYVVGLLLMYINDEETVFWCFTYLLNSENHLHKVYEASLNK